jgi:hypothetical protein
MATVTVDQLIEYWLSPVNPHRLGCTKKILVAAL